MSYKITWEEKGVSRTLMDEFTNDDILNSNHEIDSDPRLSHIEYQIINLLDVHTFSINVETFHQLGEMDAEHYHKNPNLKVSIIATQRTWSALTTMYKEDFQIAGDGSIWETQIFDNEKDAREWISSS